MMIALAIVAMAMATERFLFHYAVSLARSHGDYLWHEAVTVWIILNIALALPIGTSVAIIRAAMKDQADARKSIG
jgi:hypothetical protein